jgi:hypothetical protein
MRVYRLFPFIAAALVITQSHPEMRAQSQTQQKVKKTVPFETTLVGEMRDEDGTHLAFTVFRTPDGTKLTATHHRFDSQLDAQNYFEKLIGKATKIVNKAQRKDASGAIVAQRAEAVIRGPARSEKAVSAILWTDGSEFHEIISESSEDNLLLEKQTSN